MLAAERGAEIEQFLSGTEWAGAKRTRLAGDASVRRYERLRHGPDSAVLMDCGGVPEQVEPFLTVRAILANVGLSVPNLIAVDQGIALLLVEDFGDDSLARRLDNGGDAASLYGLAVDVLIHLHRALDGSEDCLRGLPVFDSGRWVDIVGLFADHYLPRHGRAPDHASRREYDAIWYDLLKPLDRLPISLLLRDYHAGNLHLLSDRRDILACGLIDFQDAGVGPVLYDLISLLEDARRDLPVKTVEACRTRYRAAFAAIDTDLFMAAWHALALQRHLRVIAVFDRLAMSGDDRYLVHMPRLWRYVDDHLRHMADGRLADWIRHHLPEAPWT